MVYRIMALCFLGLSLVGCQHHDMSPSPSSLACSSHASVLTPTLSIQTARCKHLRYLMTAQAVVWQVGDQLHITLPADTLFSGTQFQSDAFPLLQEVAAYLNTYYISQVKVMGFVDNPLGADQDQDLCLSRLRAQLVVNVLSSTDIDARLIFSQGFGHCEPLGDDATVIGRQINRRIEFIATKTGDRVRSCGNH